MIVILGGAYQGKLAFARSRFALEENDIFYCSEQDAVLDPAKRAVSGLHLLFLGQAQRGERSEAWAEANLPALQNSILLCDDISAGLVPMDPVLRLWREETGRALACLCRSATEVYRLFCGLETRLK